mmetsp:Transcript_2779/g.4155  ORF Transcript_2779/g.4155 Transcript_2779/m.4155 type:complete len:158 (-) Transcript_2779:88-561(-)
MLSRTITNHSKKMLSRRRVLLPSSSSTFFSSLAVENDPPRRRRRSLDPIIVTQSAADRLKELLENAEGNPVGIRLGTKRRGCNGLSYTMNYVNGGEQNQNDEHMTAPNNIEVFIEPMALMNVIGTKMDWVETELSAEFTFTNPNSKGECGCGESFNV